MLRPTIINPVSVKLQEVFARRSALILFVFFTFSLLLRYNEYNTFRNVISDKARQLHGAYELLQGNGVSFTSYDLRTFQPVSIPIVEWPPGYSYVTAAASYITRTDVYTASVLLDYLCLTLFWACILWLTALLDFTLLQSCLLFLFLGISKTPLLFVWSSDLLGCTAFLFSIALNIQFLRGNQNKRRWLYYALQFASIFIMFSMKYSLVPACLAIGLSLFSYGWFSKKNLYKTGAILILFTVASIFLLFFYNELRSGHTSGLYNRYTVEEKGLHFSNLLLFSPFLVHAFVYLDALYMRFSISVVYFMAQVLTFFLISLIVFRIVSQIRKGKADYFTHSVLITTLCVAGFLASLSVYYPKDVHPSHVWTYVVETRYFAPAIFLLMLYLFRNIRLKRPQKITEWLPSVFTVTTVGFAFLLGCYYLAVNNTAGSFQNLYGRLFRIRDYVEKQRTNETYFLSLTSESPREGDGSSEDSKVTSVVALGGTKVAVTYYDYFPDSATSLLFSKTKLVPAGKKIIIYLGQNTQILDSINLNNHHRLEQNSFGERFLVINN
jgi:hypothetical protein